MRFLPEFSQEHIPERGCLSHPQPQSLLPPFYLCGCTAQLWVNVRHRRGKDLNKVPPPRERHTEGQSYTTL